MGRGQVCRGTAEPARAAALQLAGWQVGERCPAGWGWAGRSSGTVQGRGAGGGVWRPSRFTANPATHLLCSDPACALPPLPPARPAPPIPNIPLPHHSPPLPCLDLRVVKYGSAPCLNQLPSQLPVGRRFVTALRVTRCQKCEMRLEGRIPKAGRRLIAPIPHTSSART